LCKVAQVDVDPTSAVVRVLGDPQMSRVLYSATPRGAPDSCDINGQRLNPYSYNWSWSTDFTIVGELVQPNGTSGSANVEPGCGNFFTEYGEDADYGICTYTSVSSCLKDDDCNRDDVCVSTVCTKRTCASNSDCYEGGICDTSTKCTYPAPEVCSSLYSCGQKGECTKPAHSFLDVKCLNKGLTACTVSPQTGCCGNGERELGEDCDDGNNVASDGCSATCLTEGFKYSCGNGILDIVPGSIREECDDGNKSDTDACSYNASDSDSSNDPDGYCINQGSKTDSLIDPNQLVEGVGVKPGETESTTKVNAIAESKTGKADFTVACGYTSDSQCQAYSPGSALGTDTCCHARPTITSKSPADDPSTSSVDESTDVCRNAVIVVQFSEAMDIKTFQNGIEVKGAWASQNPNDSSDCTGFDTQSLTDATTITQPQHWVQRAWHWITAFFSNIFRSEISSAASSTTFCPIQGTVTSSGDDTLIFTPSLIFFKNLEYSVTIVSHTDSSTGKKFGIQSKFGVTMTGDQTWKFWTGDEVCEINKVDIEVTPGTLKNAGPKFKTSDFFNCTNTLTEPNETLCKDDKEDTDLEGTQHHYKAFAKNTGHDEILAAYYFWIKDKDQLGNITLNKDTPGFDVLSGSYSYSSEPVILGFCGDNTTSCVHGGPACSDGSICKSVDVQSLYTTPVPDNFDTFVAVQAVSSNVGFCPNTTTPCVPGNSCVDGATCQRNQFTETMAVTSFICENPWPKIEEFPFEDEDYDYKTYYCRDFGPDGVKGDLPMIKAVEVSVTPPINPNKDELRQEYLFTFYPGYCHLPDDSITPQDESLELASGTGCAMDADCSTDEVCDLYGYCSMSKQVCDESNPTTCPAGETCVITGDAVGLRVFENTSHSSPLKWYQSMGLEGSPSSASLIDGFQTIQDFNSTYINTAVGYIPYADDTSTVKNEAILKTRIDTTTPQSFTNVSLLSVNADSNEVTRSIYSQLVENLRFGKDYDNFRYCNYDHTRACKTDMDCWEDGYDEEKLCDADKDKIRRDLIRMADGVDMVDSINLYKAKFDTYPVLAAGTYLQNNTLSVWPSWKDTFQSELKKAGVPGLPLDSLNTLYGCDVNSDPKTCWDEESRELFCPTAYWAYGYRYETPEKASVYYNLEIDQTWAGVKVSDEDLAAMCTPQSTSEGADVDARADYDLDGLSNDIDTCDYVPNGMTLAQSDVNMNKTLNEDVLVRANGGSLDTSDYDNEYYDLGNNRDTDVDDIGDACDRCWTPTTVLPAKNLDTGQDDDKDEYCYDVDSDGGTTDSDDVSGTGDNCPLAYNPTQSDYDKDAEAFDVCLRAKTPYYIDANSDGNYDAGETYCGGDACDLDADNDGYLKYNDCQETDTFSECQTYVQQDSSLYTITFGTPPDEILDKVGVWIFQGNTMYTHNPISFAEEDEMRQDYIMKTGWTEYKTFTLKPGDYTFRLRGTLESTETSLIAKYFFERGSMVQVSNDTQAKIYTTPDPSKSCVEKETSWEGDKGQLCHGKSDEDLIGGFVTFQVKALYPDPTTSRCSQFVNPDSIEVCDGVDNNCDGYFDKKPIYTCTKTGVSCAPTNPTACNSGNDGACVLTRLRNLCAPDTDGDGFSVEDGDCDDNDAAVYADSSGETHGKGSLDPETATGYCFDAKDNDCDNKTDSADNDDCKDSDKDKWIDSLDCNDSNIAIHPGAEEICDDVKDNNCDGSFDLGATECASLVGQDITNFMYKICDSGDDDGGESDDGFRIELENDNSDTNKNYYSTIHSGILIDWNNTPFCTVKTQNNFEDPTTTIQSGRFVLRISSNGTTSDLAEDPYAFFDTYFYSKVNLVKKDPTEYYISKSVSNTTFDYCFNQDKVSGTFIEPDQLEDLIDIVKESTYVNISGPLCAAENYNLPGDTVLPGYVEFLMDVFPSSP